MSTPAWIPEIFAAVMVLVAEVSAGQLVTARAWTRRPSASSRMCRRSGPAEVRSSCLTSVDRLNSVPNFCAWVIARPISACPETPVGKPR